MKDLTQVIKEARHTGHVLLSLELDFGPHHRRQPEEVLSVGGLPYLLLYADDRALAEPNSVAASLQRYDPLAEERGETLRSPHAPESTPGRARREAAQSPGTVQDNELPVGDYSPPGHSDKESQLGSTWYLALKSKSKLKAKEEKKKLEKTEQTGSYSEKSTNERVEPSAPKEGAKNPHVLHTSEHTHVKRPGNRDREGGPRGAGEENRRSKEVKEGKRSKGRSGEAPPQSPVLNFDERTMRKARRRQWGAATHGGCSRKNLREDFAHIGWSEWVVAPKAFEAYYCSGTCGFPMPKVRGFSSSVISVCDPVVVPTRAVMFMW